MKAKNCRILIVDDNKSIHEDFRKILSPYRDESVKELNELEASLFDHAEQSGSEESTQTQEDEYELDHAYQGQEALEKVRAADKANAPYALVFMDVRMPPGWDGIETIARIWQEFPYTEMVICTAFSDYSWDDIIRRLGATDRLLFLKKPFDSIAVKQMTMTQIEKWNLGAQSRNYLSRLETEVSDRTSQLQKLLVEMEEQNDALQKARNIAQEASEVKTKFITTMSHDIRTPLNGVVGMTSLLMDTLLSDEQYLFVDTVRKSCDHLITIVNDILDFSRIDAQKLNLDIAEFELRQCFDDIVELHADAAFSKKIQLSLSVNSNVPNRLKGDPSRVRQVISNLINNAIKYTDQGQVSIRCGALEKNDKRAVLRVEVEDTGVGISPEICESLFVPFKKGDSKVVKLSKGTGLGLAISKRLIELMGGTIGVQSNVGEGSCFWVEVPFDIASNDVHTLDFEKTGLANRRILIVDDSKATANVIHSALEKTGALVEVTYSKQQALTRLSDLASKDELPELVVMDMVMPNEEGLDLLRAIEQDHGCDKVKTLVLSGNGSRGDAALLKKHGARAYLSKPVREEMLYKCMKMVLADTMNGNLITRYHLADHIDKYSARVLLVEDNVVNQLVMKQMLENRGCRVTVVTNGREAVEACEKFEFKLILMDCAMPEMDGFAATAQIRKYEKEVNRHTPIVAVTVYASPEDREKCFASGMDGYLAKPVKVDDLDVILKEWLRQDELSSSQKKTA